MVVSRTVCRDKFLCSQAPSATLGAFRTVRRSSDFTNSEHKFKAVPAVKVAVLEEIISITALIATCHRLLVPSLRICCYLTVLESFYPRLGFTNILRRLIGERLRRAAAGIRSMSTAARQNKAKRRRGRQHGEI